MPVSRWPRYGSNTFSTCSWPPTSRRAVVDHLGGQPGDVVAQQAHRLADQVAHRLVLGPPVERADTGSGVKLASSTFDASATCISAVRLPSSAARSRYAPMTSRTAAGGSAAASSCSARGVVGGHGVFAMAGQHALEETAQLLARVRPGGPLVGDVRLQHRERARLRAVAPVFDRADDRGRQPGRARVQEAAELQLRADAFLQPAEHLEQVLDRRSGPRPPRVAR